MPSSDLACVIRPEVPTDAPSVFAVHADAFPTLDEAELVDALRAAELDPFVSLVAEHDSEVVGHLVFTPAQVVGDATWPVIALGPLAVVGRHQGRGIGTRLVEAGLEACRAAGAPVVVVLGHADYYPRFGFRRMSEVGLTCEFDARDENLMVAELEPGALAGRTGEVRYHRLFHR